MRAKAINLRPGWAKIPLLKRWIPSIAKRWRKWRGQDFSLIKRGGIVWLASSTIESARSNLLQSGGSEDANRQKLSELILRTKADMFLDIGAFIGLYTLTLHKQFPHMEIHAFEPHPMNYGSLTANVLLNGQPDQIHLHPFGLGDKDERTAILGKGMSASIALARDAKAIKQRQALIKRVVNKEVKLRELPLVPRSHVRAGANLWQVELRRLDSCFANKGRVIAAKVDAEGFEQEVLRGAAQLLANNKVFLQIELWDETKSIPQMEAFGLKHLGAPEEGSDNYFANFPLAF